MDKKNFIILLLTAIVAIIVVFCVFYFNKKTVNSINSQPAVENFQEIDKTNEIEEMKETEKPQVDNKVEINKSISKVKQTPVIKQKQSTIQASEIQLETKAPQKEEIITENPVQPDIYKDKNSNYIVITTEYKVATPAKYSFK